MRGRVISPVCATPGCRERLKSYRPGGLCEACAALPPTPTKPSHPGTYQVNIRATGNDWPDGRQPAPITLAGAPPQLSTERPAP